MSDLRIRAVRPEEHERLGALTVAAYDATGHPPTDSYRPSLLDVASRVEAGAEVLVAVVDGDVLGGVTLTLGDNPYFEYRPGVDGDCGFRMLAVDPAAEGRGVGGALTDACIERARTGGYRRMTITSMPWMARAHALYERRGFVRVPQLDLFFPPGPGRTYSLGLQPDTPPLDPVPYPPDHPWSTPEWAAAHAAGA